MMTQYAAEAAYLVLKTRQIAGQTQMEFAKTVGKSQSLVSKYESGQVVPPSDVIMHCVHIMESGPTPLPSMERWDAVNAALTELVRALHRLEESTSGRRAQ